MGLKKKVKTVENSLKKKAEENTTVSKGTSNDKKIIKEGTPNDHFRKHTPDNIPVVGMSLGITKNMDNYESLRVDCWLTDTVKEKEIVEQAYERILGVIDSQLQNTVNSYLED